MFQKRIKGELSFNPILVSTRRGLRREKEDWFVPQRDVRHWDRCLTKVLWCGRMTMVWRSRPTICKPVRSSKVPKKSFSVDINKRRIKSCQSQTGPKSMFSHLTFTFTPPQGKCGNYDVT